MNALQWQISRLSGAGGGIVARALKKLEQDEAIIGKWAPAPLLMELDRLLWRDKDYLEIRLLWDYLATYCYLPRLADYEVLAAAIRAGVQNSDQYFAYAAGFSQGRFIDLKYGQTVKVEKSGFLVKRAAAQKQLAEEAAEKAGEERSAKDQNQLPGGKPEENRPPVLREEDDDFSDKKDGPAVISRSSKPKRFYLNTQLDATRINRDVSRIVDEVLKYISSEGALEIRLEVQAEAANGFERQTVRAASENCRSLKIETFGFEEK